MSHLLTAIKQMRKGRNRLKITEEIKARKVNSYVKETGFFLLQVWAAWTSLGDALSEGCSNSL